MLPSSLGRVVAATSTWVRDVSVLLLLRVVPVVGEEIAQAEGTADDDDAYSSSALTALEAGAADAAAAAAATAPASFSEIDVTGATAVAAVSTK